MKTYVWYSGATDTTGKALVEALNSSLSSSHGSQNRSTAQDAVQGGVSAPQNLTSGDIVIGWGTKINNNANSQHVNFPAGVIVWNAPDKIAVNRDKLKALQVLKAGTDTRDRIVAFVPAESVRDTTIPMPLIGRKRHHQGGSGFWFCPSKHHVSQAATDGAEYFQQFIDIKYEYRVHVGFDRVFHAVKKERNASEESYRAIRFEKLKEWAIKNEVNVDSEDTQSVIKQLCHIFYKEETLPNMLIRSNCRGWKFETVANDRLPQNLSAVAISAIKALGLQFGAVDCCVDQNDRSFILEVNTGPGLQGTALTKWVTMFKNKIESVPQPMIPTTKTVSKTGTGHAKERGLTKTQSAAPTEIPEDMAIRLVKAAETDEDLRNALKLLRVRRMSEGE